MRENYHTSPETREKLRKANIGKHHSEESRKKMSESRKGEKNHMFGKHHSEESRKKMSESRKGEKNYRFGKHHSEESKEKMRKAKLGKHPSEETREKLRKANIGKHNGEKNHMFGKHFSEETKAKMRKAKLGKYKGKDNPHYGKHHSPEVKERLKTYTKEKSSNWKGGTSFLPYCEKFDRKRKKAVRDFFNNLCICDGEPQYNRELCVHHIDHDKEQGCNGKPFNLVPMCSRHHLLEITNEEEYKAYINKTLREGFKWGIWNEQEYIEKVMY